MARCIRCKEQEASAGALSWGGFLPTLIGLPPRSSDAYCKDCGGGITFLGLLTTATVFSIVLVVAIALW
jgi:hypothetical protein